MKLLIITLFTLNLTVLGCELGKKEESKTTDKTIDSAAAPDMHTSQISLDWDGSYEGVIPCTDCPGIETKLTLNKDKTYKLSVLYLEREKQPTINKGIFTWDSSGSIIKLDKAGSEMQYKVGEGRLIMLDRNGKEIERDLKSHYVLHKVAK